MTNGSSSKQRAFQTWWDLFSHYGDVDEQEGVIQKAFEAGWDRAIMTLRSKGAERDDPNEFDAAAELHRSYPALHVALCDLSQAIGNPALEVGPDSSFEVELIKEATRRLQPEEMSPTPALVEVSRLRGIASTCLAVRPTSGMMRHALEQITGLPPENGEAERTA